MMHGLVVDHIKTLGEVLEFSSVHKVNEYSFIVFPSLLAHPYKGQECYATVRARLMIL